MYAGSAPLHPYYYHNIAYTRTLDEIPKMNILDLTNESFSAAKKGIEKYKQVHPALFSHYFQYWAEKEKFSNKILTETELLLKQKLVLKNLQIIKKRLSFDFDTRNISVVLFVGQNTSNGHAFQHNDEIIVWIPIETYSTDLQVQIFATHEIIHGIHYASVSDFLFNAPQERMHLGRQLITEGMATYYTMTIQNVDEKTALWADYLSEQKINAWYAECQQKEQVLREYCLKNFSNTSDDIELYFAKDSNDIFKYRAGYYVGVQFMKWLVEQKKKEQKIFEISREDLERLALQYLSK